MNPSNPHLLLPMAHFAFLCLWGGVVAAEAVIELYPFRHRGSHAETIRFHYWIDLLVELPVIACVVGTGVALAWLARPFDVLHVVKIGCASVAVAANLACIAMVLRRRRLLDRGAGETRLWGHSRVIVGCAIVGIPFAIAAAALGLNLAMRRADRVRSDLQTPAADRSCCAERNDFGLQHADSVVRPLDEEPDLLGNVGREARLAAVLAQLGRDPLDDDDPVAEPEGLRRAAASKPSCSTRVASHDHGLRTLKPGSQSSARGTYAVMIRTDVV
jgi:hypothetical protein